MTADDIEDILKELEKNGFIERLPNGRWVATEKGRAYLTFIPKE